MLLEDADTLCCVCTADAIFRCAELCMQWWYNMQMHQAVCAVLMKDSDALSCVYSVNNKIQIFNCYAVAVQDSDALCCVCSADMLICLCHVDVRFRCIELCIQY